MARTSRRPPAVAKPVAKVSVAAASKPAAAAAASARAARAAPDAPAARAHRHHHDELDTRWHLSRDALETDITELEFSLMRVIAAFERWTAECLDTVARQPLGSAAAQALHVIGLKNRPKSPAEVARLLNRDDVANVLYSIRKLEAAGLVERADDGRRKGVLWRVTRRGRRVTTDYATLRAQVLIPRVPRLEGRDPQLATAKDFIDLMRGVYDQAALLLATHRDWRQD